MWVIVVLFSTFILVQEVDSETTCRAMAEGYLKQGAEEVICSGESEEAEGEKFRL